MFSNSGEERTIAPTPQRLADARRQGRYPHSRELTTAVVSLAAALSLWWIGPRLWGALLGLFDAAWGGPAASVRDAGADVVASPAGVRIAMLLAGLLAIPAFVAVCVNLLQRGWHVHVRLPAPVGLFANPLRRMRQMSSDASPVTIGLLIVKLAVVCVLVATFLVLIDPELVQVSRAGADAIAASIGQPALECSLLLLSGIMGIAVVEWFRGRRRFLQSLRMTRAEARDEANRSENRGRTRTRRHPVVSRSGNPLSRTSHSEAESESRRVAPATVVERAAVRDSTGT